MSKGVAIVDKLVDGFGITIGNAASEIIVEGFESQSHQSAGTSYMLALLFLHNANPRTAEKPLSGPMQAIKDQYAYLFTPEIDLENFNLDTPFNAGTGDFVFPLDNNTPLETAIINFGNGDVLSFNNTPTGSGDFNVDQAAWDDGQALIEVGETQVTLLGLSNDYFNDAASFQGIFGQDALIFG